ncbi:MAG: zinc-binding protein [Dehalococcoidia bacterium]|nr:MAG: zinc-binding protein [Dehalococcoidia bacterium]
MGFTDKKVVCADCNNEFIFSATEQEFYATKGFTNEPKRCPDCRQARKNARGGGGGGSRGSSQRQMFSATCAQCGKQTEVPFEPRQDRPVYCSDCYNSIKPKR